MDTVNRVQILDEALCISHTVNTLSKGNNPNILPPAMGNQQDKLNSFTLVRQSVFVGKKSEFKISLKINLDGLG